MENSPIVQLSTMDLLLGQIIYTSFPKIGFTSLASKQVPENIQKAFIEQIVFQYWDAYSCPPEYRAVYLYQVTPTDSLFGWLYNDGADDLGRNHVPYFICYYIAEPLSAFQLECIFTYLGEGPIEAVDRRSLNLEIKDIALPELWHYEGVRPGVEIPWDMRKRSHNALKQGKLLNLFIPWEKQEISSIELREVVPAPQLVVKASDEESSELSYTNFISLLGVGIGVTSGIILTFTLYGFLQTTIFVPPKPEISTNSEVVFSQFNPVFYKTLTDVPNVPQGLFDYSSSATLATWQTESIIAQIKQAQPQFRLRLIEPVANQFEHNTEIEMLLADELSFVQSFQMLKDSELLEAKERGFTLGEIPIAIDGIAFYINPQLAIAGLSVAQVRDIFAGKITNWKQVGGPDLQIVAFSNVQPSSRSAEMLHEKVISLENFGETVQTVNSTAESIAKVAQTPGGIGYALVSELVGYKNIKPLPLSSITGTNFVSPYINTNNEIIANKTVLADGTYPLSRKLFVIIRRDGSIDEQAGVAYVNLMLTDTGQKILSQLGFIPIR